MQHWYLQGSVQHGARSFPQAGAGLQHAHSKRRLILAALPKSLYTKSMIKAIVFDCFGVLTSDGWLPFKKKYFGHDSALTEEATSLNKQVDAGLISYDDFVPAVAKLAG